MTISEIIKYVKEERLSTGRKPDWRFAPYAKPRVRLAVINKIESLDGTYAFRAKTLLDYLMGFGYILVVEGVQVKTIEEFAQELKKNRLKQHVTFEQILINDWLKRGGPPSFGQRRMIYQVEKKMDGTMRTFTKYLDTVKINFNLFDREYNCMIDQIKSKNLI